MLIEEKYIK